LAAVVARTRTTLDETAATFALDRGLCFQDYREALGKVQAEVAVVVLPPDLHYPVLTDCLEAGLHILCEKPLTATWQQATRIAAVAAQRPSQKFMVSQTRRWSDHIQTLKSVLDAGKVGRVSFINVDHRVHNRHGGWREELAFPVLEDMAVHHFDALRFMTAAEPVSVFARSWNPHWSWYKGQACSSAIFEMTNDIRVCYFGSWCTQGQQTAWEGRIQIVGEKGSIDLVNEQTLHFYPAETDREPGTSPDPEVIPIIPLDKREIDYALNEFCESVLQDRTPEVDVRNNLGTMAMACAAVESSKRGTTINIADWLSQV